MISKKSLKSIIFSLDINFLIYINLFIKYCMLQKNKATKLKYKKALIKLQSNSSRQSNNSSRQSNSSRQI